MRERAKPRVSPGRLSAQKPNHPRKSHLVARGGRDAGDTGSLRAGHPGGAVGLPYGNGEEKGAGSHMHGTHNLSWKTDDVRLRRSSRNNYTFAIVCTLTEPRVRRSRFDFMILRHIEHPRIGTYSFSHRDRDSREPTGWKTGKDARTRGSHATVATAHPRKKGGIKRPRVTCGKPHIRAQQ